MAQYSIQKVPQLVGRDITTGEPKVTLTLLKDLTFTNGSETVPLTQDGVPLLHFEHSKSFGLSGTNTTIDDYLMSLQLGTNVEVVSASTGIKILETVTTTVADEATLTYTPTGTAGSEVVWAELVASDNSSTKFEQATVLAAGKFTVSGKALSFNATEMPVGSKVRVSYFPTASIERKIQNLASNYIVSLEWDVHCRFLDACSKEEVKGYINIPSGCLKGSFEWDTSEGGDPATHSFELMAERGCTSAELYTIHYYSEDNLS